MSSCGSCLCCCCTSLKGASFFCTSIHVVRVTYIYPTAKIGSLLILACEKNNDLFLFLLVHGNVPINQVDCGDLCEWNQQ